MLKLISLVAIFKDKGVEVALASDFEFDLTVLRGALYPCGYVSRYGFISIPSHTLLIL